MAVNDRARVTVIDPKFLDRSLWPKADSSKICIFEAIDLTGQAHFGDKWSGREFEAGWWSEQSDRAKQAAFLRARSPAPINSGGTMPSPIDRRRASQLGMSDDAWARAQKAADLAVNSEEVAWNKNKEQFQRLAAVTDWLAGQCRDGLLTGYYRLRLGGALAPMAPSDWNVEAPLATFVSDGGNKRWVDMSRPQYREIYVFVDKAQLEASLALFAHSSVEVSLTDVSHLSPYLQLAIKLALSKDYTSTTKAETQAVREAEIRQRWSKAMPEIPISRTAVEAIAKVMGFPDPTAILQGQSAHRNK